jgi:hypothetical protein
LGEILDGKTFGEILASEHKDHFYIMHLSYGSNKTHRERLWNYAVSNNLIGLDWYEATRDWVTLTEAEQQSLEHTGWILQFNLFCHDMQIGDYVVILNGTYSLLGVARVLERHRFDFNLSSNFGNPDRPNRFFDHIRRVKWIKTYQYDGCILSQRLTFSNTIAKVTPQTRSPRWKVLTAIDP